MPRFPATDVDHTLTILEQLIAFESLPETPNGAIVGWIQSYLEKIGITCHIVPGPEGDRSNIFATIGPKDVPGYVLSGHMDVVSVKGQTWASDPFVLTEVENGKFAGRGASDMKGFLACVLSMSTHFASLDMKRPIHLAFSYDEEIGCRGVPHLITRLGDFCAQPLACIVGEPSDMKPVLSHKGKVAFELTFTGRAAHSSNPYLGENAIYPAAETILFAKQLAASLAANGPHDQRFEPSHSTLVASVINGGTAVNIIPDACSVRCEVRSIPGQDAKAIADRVIERASQLVIDNQGAGGSLVLESKILSDYPALESCGRYELISLLENLSGNDAVNSVSYGTEAGLFAKGGISSIICGPGSISRAHRPDEYIERSELEDCLRLLSGVAEHCCGA